MNAAAAYTPTVGVIFLVTATLLANVRAGALPLEAGLYNRTDKVLVLTDANFKEAVLHQNRSILVEFYNSYCGHCRRFAPHYKQLAEQLYGWREVLPVSAVDCVADENNDICREYEIMIYPTLRYFGPNFTPSPKNYGRFIESQEVDVIRATLAKWISLENCTDNMSSWPNFEPLSDKVQTVLALFEGLGSECEYVILVYEPENTTVGIETILNFVRWPAVQIRRVTDLELASKYQIDGIRYKIATVSRQGTVVPYSAVNESSFSYSETIRSFLKAQHFTERTSEYKKLMKEEESTTASSEQVDQKAAIIKEVQRNKHMVYQADLEMAIRTIVFNEIPRMANISGERLLALQKLLSVLDRYNPLGPNGRAFIKRVYDFTMRHSQGLSGKDFKEELIRLEKELPSPFSSNHFVGCLGSEPAFRGFTCSVWQLFHFMTVQAANSEISQDPLEVLQAMHGYVKNFFGCTHCSNHFQAMASRRKIWNTPSKDEAVLWLWAAHNEVNQRLSGDATEDPQFRKIQFPSQSSCPLCYKQPQSTSASLEGIWDKIAVLSFLKNIHNAEYINRYGVENVQLLSPLLGKLRQKRMIGSVFSDVDMRMGILLYGFCIVMLGAAFKLFVFKGGYRKKHYGHDMLGKV